MFPICIREAMRYSADWSALQYPRQWPRALEREALYAQLVGVVSGLGVDLGPGENKNSVGPLVGILFLTAAGLLVGSTAFTWWVGRIAQDSTRALTEQRSVIEELDHVLWTVEAAETGQWGYLLTGQDQYLESYNHALPEVHEHLKGLGHLVTTGHLPAEPVARVTTLVQEKLSEVDQTIQVRREQGLEPALVIVRSDRGRRIMESIRSEVARMRVEEEAEFHQAGGRAERATILRTVTFILTALLNLGFLSWAYRRIHGDMSQRRRAEEAAREAHRQVSTLLESISDSYYAMDRGWCFTQMNRNAAEYFGVEASSMVGRVYWDALPKARGSVFEIQYRKAMREGVAVHFEVYSPATSRWVEAHAYPSSDGLFVYFREITERKKREEELHRLNRTLKALSQSDQAMLRAKDEQQYIGEVCRVIVEGCGHAMAWVGYTEQDANKTVRPVAYAGFDEGYIDALRITWADTERGQGPTGTAIRTGKPSMCCNMQTDPRFEPWREEALKRGYASSIVLPLMADGGVFGALTIYCKSPDPFVEDEVQLLSDLASDLAYGITAIRLRLARARAEQELREAAEQRRLAMEAADLGAWDYRFDSGEVFWDDRCRDLFGVPAGDQVRYDTVISLIHPEDRAATDEAVRQAIAGKDGGAYHEEYRVIWGDGSVHWVASHGRAHFEGEGSSRRAVRFVGVNMDITERKQGEDALRKVSEDLQRSNQDLEQFAYVASHDLQEPLRMVAGYLQLIERRYKDKIDPAGREFIDFAVDGSTRMSRLISDLLDYSRINMRGKPAEPVEVEMVLGRVMRNLSASIAESGAVITHDPLPTVQADGTQLLQLFQNLIGNAIKFRCTDRPCRIHVAAWQKDAEWVFCIKDNGIGIDPQYAEQIFLIFQRLHSRKQYAGTGIGLAICKRIVERHGGRIWVEGCLGQGSTFFCTLDA